MPVTHKLISLAGFVVLVAASSVIALLLAYAYRYPAPPHHSRMMSRPKSWKLIPSLCPSRYQPYASLRPCLPLPQSFDCSAVRWHSHLPCCASICVTRTKTQRPGIAKNEKNNGMNNCPQRGTPINPGLRVLFHTRSGLHALSA